MFESAFQFLFKYQPLVFEQGRFVLGATRSMWLAAAAAGAAGLYVLWTYRRLALLAPRERGVLLGLRVGLFALVLFALLRPMLLLKVAVPQQNFVGILLDDSRSMQVADEGGRARSEYVRDQFGRTDGPLLAALGQRFSLRIFRFSTVAERLQAAGDLRFEGTGTRLAEAFGRARDELSGLPVAGLVLVSDGADTTDETLDEAMAALKAQAMPVFAIGVGRDRLTRDVQVTRAETPRRALKGSSLVVDVVVTQTGYAGRRVPLVVEDEGRVLGTQEIALPPDGESATVKVRVKVADLGPRVLRFHVPVQAQEEVPQNNGRHRLIEVYDRREKVLYLEGEPRPEAKFVRLAANQDDNLQVALLQRTAMATSNVPDKYLRLGVESAEELQAGFPATREELYAYRAIVLGTVEASAFTAEQQRMLEDFVDTRGGGLLALGGPASFAEGGWAGTPLAAALPVVLERGTGQPRYPPLELVVQPTPAGANHPATQITERAEDAAGRWRDLPPLTSVNALGEVKPGATVLLTGITDRGRDQPVLAYQRYGRGKALLLGVQDSWLWQMHARVAVDDQTHEALWQRLLRWLVDGVPDRVMVATRPDRAERGEPVTVTADVFDKEFRGVNDGQVTARVTSPSGRVEDVPMEWTIEREGEYTARFTPTEDGLYKVAVSGEKGGTSLGRAASTVRVAPSEAEYFDAAMRRSLLERIAEETSGRFYRASDTASLVDAITYSGSGITVVEERELWDMPVNLLLLLALMGGEWMYRRRRGLA